MQKIIIQPELCDGCRDCEEACKKLYGASRIMIRELEGLYYPIICQQCEDAPCRTVCPTDAIRTRLTLSGASAADSACSYAPLAPL